MWPLVGSQIRVKGGSKGKESTPINGDKLVSRGGGRDVKVSVLEALMMWGDTKIAKTPLEKHQLVEMHDGMKYESSWSNFSFNVFIAPHVRIVSRLRLHPQWPVKVKSKRIRALYCSSACSSVMKCTTGMTQVRFGAVQIMSIHIWQSLVPHPALKQHTHEGKEM